MHTAIIGTETLSILYLIILLCSMFRKEDKHQTSKAFIICLIVAVLGVGMDLLSYLLEYTTTNQLLLTVVNILSFFGYDFELMAFAIYVWTIVAEKEEVSKSFVSFINFLCIADILFIIIGTISGNLFSIVNGDFITGPWYNFGGVIGFIILVSLLAFTIRKRKTVGNVPLVFVAIFFLITYTSIFITLFTGIDSYMYVCMSLVMLLVYIILQTGEIERGQIREKIMYEMSNTDVLTKLNNRRAFESVLNESTNISNVGVVFCDVNGLKTTNDNLGHAAGDDLLLRFCNLLKNHFPSSDIFRISGDEFVVLRLNAEKNEFFVDINNLREDISNHDDIASVGSTYGDGSNIVSLVSIAEKDMYADKKAYYERHGFDRRRR